MNITTSEYKTVSVKSRKQIEEEREAYIQQTVQRIQEEALSLSKRVKTEEETRFEMIKREEERMKMEELKRLEIRRKTEEEREQREQARMQEMQKQQQMVMQKQAEQKRLLQEKLKREEEERRKMELVRSESLKQKENFEQKDAMRKQEELRLLEEARYQEEQRINERRQLESMIERESKAMKGQVTRRMDDPYGQGFGFVKTGYVSSQKLSFLQRASSVDRYDFRADRGSPVPSNDSGRGGKGLRVTWAESPLNSRPASNLGWTDKVAEMDSQTVRAQTPPLAGEWAVSKGSTTDTKSVMSSTKTQSLVQSSNTAFASSNAQATNNFPVKAAITNDTKLATNGFSMTSGSQATKFASFSSQNMSSAQNMSSSQNMSSIQSMSSSQKESSKTSMFSSSSSSFKSSSSFQSGSVRSQTFEAFPGMGGIENLNLEGEKAGN